MIRILAGAARPHQRHRSAALLIWQQINGWRAACAGMSLIWLAACGTTETPAAAAAPPAAPLPAQEAPCVVPPKGEPMMCTQQYEPVCGCDGKTYGNACVASSQGVQRFRPGRCGDPVDAGDRT